MESAVTSHPLRSRAAEGGGLVPLSFPATRSALWDHRSKGTSSVIHVSHYRNPCLVIEEKTLRLAQRYAQENEANIYSCLLSGSIQIDHDGEGIQICIDRFHEGNHLDPDPDQLVVPCVVHKNTSSLGCPGVEELSSCLKMVHQRCISKDKIEMSQFLSVRANCGYHSSQLGHMFHADFDVVTMETAFKATPINAVPLVPTALSKNLSGPMSMSEVQGEPKTGYITMDHTRKALLILESDPKVATLPLIGIWVSGVASVYHPVVWASCLRYLHNLSLQDRVCIPPESFLLILYSPLHSRPEFYDCCTLDGKTQLSYQLLSCHDVIQLPKDLVSRPDTPLELELCCVESGKRKDVFHAALEDNKQLMRCCKKATVAMPHKSGSFEDITPRAIPSPHHTQMTFVKPSVPEVTLIFDDSETSIGNSRANRLGQSVDQEQGYPSNSVRGPLKPVNGNIRRMPHSSKDHNNIGRGIQGQSVGYVSQNRLPHNLYETSANPSDGVILSPRPFMHPRGAPVSSQTGNYITSHPSYTFAPGQGASQPSARPHLMQAYQPEQYSQSGPVYGTNPRLTGPPPSQPDSHNQGNINQNFHYNDSMSPQIHEPQYHLMQPGGPRPYGPPPTQTRSPYPNMYSGIPPQPHGQYNPHYPLSNPVNPSIPPYQNYPVASGPISIQQSQVQEPDQCSQPQSLPSHISSSQGQIPLQDIQRQHLQTSQWGQGPASVASFKGTVHPATQAHTHRPPHCSSSGVIPAMQARVPIPSQRSQSKSASRIPQGNPSSDGSEPSASCTTHPESVSASMGIIDTTLGSATSAGEVPAEVYNLLHQQDMQLKELREQLRQLMSKQSSTVSDSTEQLPTPRTDCKSVDIQTSALNTPASTKKSDAIKQTCSIAINTSLCWSDQSGNQNTQIQLQSTNTSKAAHHPLQRDHYPGNKTSVSTSPERLFNQLAKPSSKGNSPGQQSSDPSATLSNDSFGDLHLTNLHDRTEESMMSELIVDMPAYTSLSPDKLGNPGGNSGYEFTDDSSHSPLMGESVSMYQDQLMEAQRYDQEDSGDTGLGDSHPEASLLFNDQKQFYENLIGSVKKFLAKHNDVDDQKDSVLNQSILPPNTSYTHSQNNQPGINTACSGGRSAHDDHTESHSMGDDGSYLGGHIPYPANQKKGQSTCRSPVHVVPSPDLTPDLTHASIDVEAYTRQHLKKLGIDLESLNETEKTQWLNQSLMLMEPAMLPKIQYVSMLNDSDTDMSADADSLAMKYLSDEQLAELAKLRMRSPKKPEYGHDKGLSRLVMSGIGSANVTMYGMHDKNMSFATRKYMQRYGLIDSDKREKDISHPPEDTSREELPEAAAYSVKEFLQKLSERSFMGNSFVHSGGNSHQNHRRPRGSVDSSSGTSSHSSFPGEHLQCHSDGDNSRVLGSSNAAPYRHQYSTTSDTTQYHSSSRSPVHQQRNRHKTDLNGSGQAPAKVFNNKHIDGGSPIPSGRQNPHQEHGHYSNQRNPESRNSSDLSASPQINNRILDIERLKELPKLL